MPDDITGSMSDPILVPVTSEYVDENGNTVITGWESGSGTAVGIDAEDMPVMGVNLPDPNVSEGN